MIYTKEVFNSEIKKLLDQGRLYCPDCYSINILDVSLTYSKYDIKSRVRGLRKCDRCSGVFKSNEILTKSEVRNKKIDEVLS